MFKNRNINIVNKVVRKILMAQKSKNIVTIIAIIISATLFTSLTTLIEEAVRSQTLMMQMQAGSKADAEVKGMKQSQYELFIRSSLIKEVGLRRPITFLSNTKHHNIELDHLDEKAQEMFFSKPTHGTAPKNDNEIATSDKALRDLGVEPKIGEKVKIVFKLKGNQEEYSYEMVVSGWWEAINEQNSLMLVSDEFMDQNNDIFENNRKQDFELGRYSAEVILRNKRNADVRLKEIVRAIGGETEDERSENFVSVVINKHTSVELKEILLPVAFIMILFLLCSYLLIYNIFDITIVKDIKSYGLLSIIGTTSSQIKKIVLKQALFLSIIGIPIGLLIGYIIGIRLLPIAVSGMLAEGYSNIPIINSADPSIFIFGTFMTLITIFISVYKPARSAAKYNAVEATKYSEFDQPIKGKKIKNKVRQIAYSNFMRNKKRAILIVISLSICIIFFNSIFIVSSSMDTKKFLSVHMKTDYIAANANAFNLNKGYIYREDGMAKEFSDFLDDLSGIKEMGYLYKNTKDDNNVSFDYGIKIESVEAYPNEEGIMENYGVINIRDIELGAPLSDDGRLRCNVYGADKVTSERFQFDDMLSGMSDKEIKNEFLSGNYIIEGAMIDPDDPEEISEIPGYQCNIGQKVTAYKNGKKYKTYTVLAHMPVIQAEVEANDGVNGATWVGQDAAKFYFPISEFNKLYDKPTLLNCTFNAVDDSMKRSIDRELEQYIEQNPLMGYYSSEELIKAINSEQRKFYTVGGIIAGVLGLVGIINFINLIITSVISRKNDFAIMESIGMTPKQLKQMIVWEGIFYAGATGVLGLLVSYGIGEVAIKKILSFTWYYTFKMSLIPGMLIWICMLVIVILSSDLSMSILNKGELSDRLSKEA